MYKMKRQTKQLNNRKGMALIMAMIFIAVFSTLSAVIVTKTSRNVQTAANHRRGNRAYENALSGLEYMRYWLDRVEMPYTITPAKRFEEARDYVYGEADPAGVTVTTTYDSDGDPNSFSISNFAISTDNKFTATVYKTSNLDIVQVCVTGTSNSLERNVTIDYKITTRSHNVFDFGVATRGPLDLSGSAGLLGTQVAADVYIESVSAGYELSLIGKSQITGDVQLTNPGNTDDTVHLQGGAAAIGSENGADAIANHVTTGVAPVEFPVPVPTYFAKYIETVYDPNTMTLSNGEHRNIKIPAGSSTTDNPMEITGATFNGILYIEAPNSVTFLGSTTINGLIVGAGDVSDNSCSNKISFLGNVISNSVATLPDDYGELRSETGTFLLAPGFMTIFSGDFETLNGAIASNGVKFLGNAGGVIAGSVLNYSNNIMELSGNNDLTFMATAENVVPAGFGPEFVVTCLTTTYSEVALN
jgi:type II secretory pathway pseudopilin PulG